ncbi:MAG: hypothetical protein HYY26_00835 [Acidobacteria bacterium]|nr:hypothetical protein [Acidobacteriota bacterium]
MATAYELEITNEFPCPTPLRCGQLHCVVCTAHLGSEQQRFCSARCRWRARKLRKGFAYCPQCRAPLWLPKSLARRLRAQAAGREPVEAGVSTRRG